MNGYLVFALLTAISVANSALATCPQLDTVEHEGKVYSLARYTSPPYSQKVDDWVNNLPWCSAPGHGRAGYRVEGNQIFLVKFSGCIATLSVSDAFSQLEPKKLATWLNGKLDVALGNCNGGWDPAKEYFIVNQGTLIEFVQATQAK